MRKWPLYVAVWVLVLHVGFEGCSTGVEPSPGPGILRVTLQASADDTTIIIRSDTSRFSRWDEFNLTVSQGKVYRGANYALLYADPTTARITGVNVNIIKREWLSGAPILPTDFTEINTKNSRYVKYIVFESYVPPGKYDSLSFSLTASEILIFIPTVYTNPVQLPAGTTPQMQIPVNIEVAAGRTTQVNLEIYPFSSLYRFRDSYLFSRKMKVVSVDNL